VFKRPRRALEPPEAFDWQPPVDEARAHGERAGLIKVKTYRPFPLQAMTQALAHVDAVGVVDRSVSFGWNSGPLYQDVLCALGTLARRIPALSFIGGLAGADMTTQHFARVLETTRQALVGAQPLAPVWMNETDR